MSSNFIPTGPQDSGQQNEVAKIAEGILRQVGSVLPFRVPFIKIHGGAQSEPVRDRDGVMETWTAVFEFELPDHPAEVAFSIAGFEQKDLSPDDHIKAMYEASVYVTNLLKQAMNDEL